MACCLYSSLSSLGHFDANDVAARYVKWSDVAFDIGIQTSRSLAVVAEGESHSRQAGSCGSRCRLACAAFNAAIAVAVLGASEAKVM